MMRRGRLAITAIIHRRMRERHELVPKVMNIGWFIGERVAHVVLKLIGTRGSSQFSS